MAGRKTRDIRKTRRWAALARRIRERDNFECQKCGAWANECDHVVPLSKGGAPYDEKNCQILCRTCHIAKSRSEMPRQTPGRAEWIERLRQHDLGQS